MEWVPAGASPRSVVQVRVIWISRSPLQPRLCFRRSANQIQASHCPLCVKTVRGCYPLSPAAALASDLSSQHLLRSTDHTHTHTYAHKHTDCQTHARRKAVQNTAVSTKKTGWWKVIRWDLSLTRPQNLPTCLSKETKSDLFLTPLRHYITVATFQLWSGACNAVHLAVVTCAADIQLWNTNPNPACFASLASPCRLFTCIMCYQSIPRSHCRLWVSKCAAKERSWQRQSQRTKRCLPHVRQPLSGKQDFQTWRRL